VKRLFKTLIIVIAFAAPPGFAAEDYPVRPIRFIVPMPAGGALDAAARILGTNLAEILRQAIVIDNRSGAQGNVATALGARAAPDGYTMTLGFAGSLAINPHLYSNP
jgi:tripartite-type tricarboxylate transporter receptor subunit TctC